MPASAYALLATFVVISLAAGLAASRFIGPWQWWTAIVPALAAFGVLYLVGHRFVVSIGPELTLWGWRVALPFDVAVAVAAAVLTALLQRGAVALLQA